MVERVWQELDSKDRDFVVSYKRKVKHNESTVEIDVPENFWDLFKDKYSTPRKSQSRLRLKIIFNLNQDYKEKEVK